MLGQDKNTVALQESDIKSTNNHNISRTYSQWHRKIHSCKTLIKKLQMELRKQDCLSPSYIGRGNMITPERYIYTPRGICVCIMKEITEAVWEQRYVQTNAITLHQWGRGVIVSWINNFSLPQTPQMVYLTMVYFAKEHKKDLCKVQNNHWILK